MIEANRFQSPIGPLSIIAIKSGVVKIAFSNKSDEEIKKWCFIHLGTTPEEGTDSTTQAKRQILNYLIGTVQAIINIHKTSLLISGTPYLDLLRTI